MTMSTIVVAALALFAGEGASVTQEVSVLPGEGWWGVADTFGWHSPYALNKTEIAIDIRRHNQSNQSAPLLVSTKGRYVWSDDAFAFSLKDGRIRLDGSAPFEVVQAGKTLRDAFKAASAKHFPPSGMLPDLALFEKPQWNTWIELTYNQNQADILAYARAIKANGFPSGGVIMIDDTWQLGYGVWQFDPRRFSDPKAMVDELHAEGYKVMLWVVPFVSMDSPGYREMAHGLTDGGRYCEKGGLLMDERDDTKVVGWWNGKSAQVDPTSPLGAKWFARELKRLQTDYGVDGFKLDAGDSDTWRPPYKTYAKASPSELCEAYAKIGLQFPLNEYRACFKMGGQPLVQRLCDKAHDWPSVQRLVPDMIACGLLGCQFVCPDMIGGGSWMAFAPDAPTPFDAELFVRGAQTHALAPMMQFSAAPWRMLKGEHLDAVRAAAWLRMRFTPYIVQTARESAKSGEPMLRAMEYEFPGCGFEKSIDQFMMGSDLLVAPQTVKGAASRKVLIPPGEWQGDDGSLVKGPCEVEVATPLSRLPHFVRKGAKIVR